MHWRWVLNFRLSYVSLNMFRGRCYEYITWEEVDSQNRTPSRDALGTPLQRLSDTRYEMSCTSKWIMWKGSFGTGETRVRPTRRVIESSMKTVLSALEDRFMHAQYLCTREFSVRPYFHFFLEREVSTTKFPE